MAARTEQFEWMDRARSWAKSALEKASELPGVLLETTQGSVRNRALQAAAFTAVAGSACTSEKPSHIPQILQVDTLDPQDTVEEEPGKYIPPESDVDILPRPKPIPLSHASEQTRVLQVTPGGVTEIVFPGVPENTTVLVIAGEQPPMPGYCGTRARDIYQPPNEIGNLCMEGDNARVIGRFYSSNGFAYRNVFGVSTPTQVPARPLYFEGVSAFGLTHQRWQGRAFTPGTEPLDCQYTPTTPGSIAAGEPTEIGDWSCNYVGLDGNFFNGFTLEELTFDLKMGTMEGEAIFGILDAAGIRDYLDRQSLDGNDAYSFDVDGLTLDNKAPFRFFLEIELDAGSVSAGSTFEALLTGMEYDEGRMGSNFEWIGSQGTAPIPVVSP